MTDEELDQCTLELRANLNKTMMEFWEEHKNFSSKEIFIINSIVNSFMVAQSAFSLFKKDLGLKPMNDYIDNICENAKQQLQSIYDHIKKDN